MSTSDREAQDDAAELAAATGMLDEMDLKSFDPEEARGFDGIGEAFKGLLAPSAAAGRTIMMAGAPVAVGYDEYMESFSTPEAQEVVREQGITPKPRTNANAAQDAYFGEVVEGLGTRAVESWRPDTSAMGATAKALSTVNTVVGSVPQMIGAPALFLANSGIDPTTELLRQGVDLKTASGVGAVNLAVNALGMKLPAAFGSTLATRVATGAGANLTMGIAADAGSAELLESGGYLDAAAGYDATDPYSRGLDLLMGLAFGAKAHIDAPRLLPSQKDAVLVALNADHYQRSTMPGEPIAAGADIRHQDGLDIAIQQILRGERVDVGAVINAQDFTLRPELRELVNPPTLGASQAGGPPAASYAAYRQALESGGKANARPIDGKTGRRLSEAYGIDQFIPATWRTVVAKAKPAWAEGLTDAQLLEARADPAKSAEMVAALDAGHATSLKAASLPVNHHTLYAAHHFGINKGKAFARAGDSTRMELILTEGQIKANPYLKGKTKAEAIANWDQRAAKAGVEIAPGRMDAADSASLIADSGAQSRPPPIPEEAFASPRTGAEAGRIIDARLQQLEELVQAGPLESEEYQQLQRRDGEIRTILRREEALDRDGVVRSDPASVPDIPALAQEQIEIAHQLDLARGSTEFGGQLQRLRERLDRIDQDGALIALADELEPQPRVIVSERTAPEGLDDGLGRTSGQGGPDASTASAGFPRNGAETSDRGIAGDDADGRADQTTATARTGGNRDLVDVGGRSTAARSTDGAPVSDAAQTNGRADLQGRGGRDSPNAVAQQPLTTAEAVVRLDPSLRIPTGEVDAEGNPVTTSASEYLEAAKAEAASADVDALAVHAAADCFLRSAA